MGQSVVRPIKPDPGCVMGICAPSSPVDRKSIEAAADFLSKRGHRVKLAEHLFERRGYLAGSDEHRAEDFNAMFASSDVQLILVAKGGYGAARILNRLDYGVIQSNPKPLVGFSDVTAIQTALLSRCNLVSFYGPLAAVGFSGRSASRCYSGLMDLLSARPGFPLIGSQWPRSVEVLSSGQAEGRLIGGCLSVLVSLLGTPFFPNVERPILFIEDVDEPPYRIDRYLTQLELAGVLGSASAILVGSLAHCYSRRKKPTLTAREVLMEKLGSLGCPVVIGMPFGHIAGGVSLPQGVRARLDTDTRELELMDSPCANRSPH